MKGCPKCGQQFSGAEEFCPQDGSTLEPLETDETDPLIGTTLDGRYAIQSLLGEGGMGVVYLAIHAVIGKKCAVKVLRQEIANENDVSERFIQEARSAAAIGNEHVIEITDFGQTPDGSPYFVMEYLEGRALHDVLKATPKLEIPRALHIIGQCCEALAKAHEVGVIHRDLKPENLFLIKRGSDEDYVKVLDFGIAKVARETGRLTRTGTIFGTPQYMSPEQAAGTSMDERTDIYSLGIIMYEMLCGKVPFEADTFMGVLTKHLYEEPIPPSRRSPPVELEESVESVVLKSIAKKRDRRYRTMTEFQADLEAILAGETPHALHEKIRESTMPPSPSQIVGDSDFPAMVSKVGRRSASKSKRSSSKVPIIAGVIVVLALLGGGGWFFLASPTDGDQAASAAVVPPVSPSASDSKETPPAPSEPQPVTVTVKSTPAGAELFRDGASIGTLPKTIERPPAGASAVVYQVKLSDHEAQEISIGADGPADMVVEMKPAQHTAKNATHSDESSKTASKKSKRRKKRRDKKEKKRLGGDIVNPWD